jgi:hypothetical protein
MAKPASPSRLLGSLIILALLLGSTTAFSQEAPKPADSDQAESEEAVFIPVEYRAPPWQVSVGIRMAGKAKVKFSQLGAVPTDVYPGSTAASDSSTTNYGRTYADGKVLADSTYALNSDGSTYSRISPTDGKTNYWNFSSAEQVVDLPDGGGKALAFHAYVVETAGTTAAVEKNSQIAWDIEISRELGSNRRMSWGLLFGAAISDINCKTDATIKAKLRTLTDYYSLTGVTLPTDYTSGTSYSGVEEYYPYTYKLNDNGTYATDSSGAYIPVYQYDSQGNKLTAWTTAQRISTDPTKRTDVTEETASLDCIGHWEVKGAYMTARFGPFFSYQLTRRLSLRASAGITFTVIGARLLLNERVLIPATKAYMQLTNENLNLDAKVNGILGYFASCELDTYFTDRTGMFFAASHEDFEKDFSMSYYAQHADISLSTGTVLRTGITTRF